MIAAGRRDVGAWLRASRERRGLSLERVSHATRIPRESLRRIEEERWAELPADAYVRGFLKAFARALDLDPGEVLAAYERARAGELPEELRPPPQANLKIRRAGMTVAVLILIVLLTLIVAMVLRPRRRGPPILSAAGQGLPSAIESRTA